MKQQHTKEILEGLRKPVWNIPQEHIPKENYCDYCTELTDHETFDCPSVQNTSNNITMTNFIKTMQERGREEWMNRAPDFGLSEIDTLIADTTKAIYQDLLDSGLLNEIDIPLRGSGIRAQRDKIIGDIRQNEVTKAIKDYIDKVKEV